MSFLQESQPDWQSYAGQTGDIYKRLEAGYRPSTAVERGVAQSLNQQANTNFNTGLTGSSIARAAQAQGTAQAYDADKNRYMDQALQIFGPVSQGDYAVSQYNKQLPMSIFGSLLPIAGAAAGGLMGGPMGAEIGSKIGSAVGGPSQGQNEGFGAQLPEGEQEGQGMSLMELLHHYGPELQQLLGSSYG